MDRTWLLFTKAVSTRDSRVRLAIDLEERRPQISLVRDDDAIPQLIEIDNESSCSCCAARVVS